MNSPAGRQLLSAPAGMAGADVDVADFELLLVAPQGLREHDLLVECDTAHDRRPLSAADEQAIEQTWERRLSANPALFNGTKFRFARVAGLEPARASDRARLCLGVTDYKSFLGTNCSPDWRRLLAASPADAWHLASPLGNAAVVETSDHCVVLLRRSGNVGEVPHSVVMPGGHPEPEMVEVASLAQWKEHGAEAASSADWHERVRRELWDAVLREVVEETGVPRASLQPPLCIGVGRRALHHRPVMHFVVRCELPSAQVRRLYATGGAVHRFESEEILFLEQEELVREALGGGALPMPGCHRGGVELYRLHLEARRTGATL